MNPGDAILADDNGIAVIPRTILDDTISASQRWYESEQVFLKQLREDPNLCYPDVTGASEIVESRLLGRG